MSDEELAKDLGLLSALTIGIGTMVGAGIFVLPGVAAQEAGPIVVVSFVVGGLIAMVNAFAVSELGTAMPKAGGGYYYVNRALGPLFGSISGMGDWMGLAFASAFYCIGFGSYLVGLLDGTAIAIPTLELGAFVLRDIQIGALIAGLIFVGVNYIGAKETGGVQTVIVLILLSILTIFAIAGFFQFDWGTLTADGFAPMGYGELLPGTALVFVAFLGYAKIATVAEELKNPGRNLPLAVIGSVAIVTVVYAILVSLMVGIVPYDQLSRTIPVAQVAEITLTGVLGALGVTIITVAALLATASSANASILSSARINFAMGREKIVTNWLNEIHPRFTTPYRSILVTGGVIIFFIVALGQDLEILAKAASVLHLIVYGLMNLALIVMREADVPEYDPDFTVPLYPLTPILGALFSFGLIAFMEPIEILLSLGFVVGAVVWYFVYARNHAENQGVLSQYIQERSEQMPDSAVAAAEGVQPDGGEYKVMVPLANPEHETELITLASAVAKQRGGSVLATHIVTVPDQTSLSYGADHVDELDAQSADLLAAAEADAETFGVPVETQTILSHRSFEEIFTAAESHEADLVVMGWGPDAHGSPGRAESAIDELAHDLPCDFLVLKNRGFDPSQVLVPTAGGPDSELSAAIATMLQAEYDSEVTLLHVADDEDTGRAFLSEWADENGLGDADLRIETGNVETAIETAADDATLMIIGATEEGLLERLVRGSLVLDVVDEVECSVLLAEKARDRSLLERLFG